MVVEANEPGFTGSTLDEYIEFLECMKVKYTALWLAYTAMQDRPGEGPKV